MAHNKHFPLYSRDTDPNLPQVVKLADKLYQWDGTSNMPLEIQNSDSAMPPIWSIGNYVIWSDTHTMGYTNASDAALICYTDSGLGDARILKVINHVAKRLGQSKFTDITAAKAWADAEPKIYVAVMTDTRIGVCNQYQITFTNAAQISYIPCGSLTGNTDTINLLPGVDGGSAVNFSGNQSYPAIQSVNLGQSTGPTNLSFEAFNVPDRFIVNYNGAVAIDTGYRGGHTYNYGGSARSSFNNSLTGKVDPLTGGTYPLAASTPGIEADGYPTVTAPGNGNISFNKNVAGVTAADVRVYAPMSGTAWNLNLGLPNGETQVTGGSSSNTIVIGSAELPTVISGTATIVAL